MRRIWNVLQHWFVAHPGNDHKPALLRSRSLGVIAALVLVAQGLVVLQSAPVVSRFPLLGEILSSVLVAETNAHRAGSAAPTLRPSAVLDAAAAAKARDMAAKSYFAHTSPEGLSPWHWFEQFGYRYKYAGENLAVNFADSKEVTDAWMASPGHRANILNRQFQEIGIGMARGLLEDREVVFVVQLFGTPITTPQPSRTATPAPATPKPVAPAPKPAAPLPAEQPLFVAIAGADSPEDNASSTTSTAPIAEAGPSIPVIRGDAAAAAVLGHPKGTANALTLFFTLIIGLVLLGKIAKVGMAHPRLVASALFVFALSAGAFVVNHYQFVAQARVL